MHFIKEIFNNKINNQTHKKLIRYGKGVFQGPWLKLKIVGSKVNVSSTFHYVDEFYEFIFSKIFFEKIPVDISITYNEEISEKLLKLGVKNLQKTSRSGIFKFKFEAEMDLDLFKKLRQYKILFNLKNEIFSMRVKESYPKPNKDAVTNFCRFQFSKEFIEPFSKEFLFDLEHILKEVEISHTIEVEDVELPKKIVDFKQARIEAKRIGKVIRKIQDVNGEEVREVKFRA